MGVYLKSQNVYLKSQFVYLKWEKRVSQISTMAVCMAWRFASVCCWL